MTLRQAVVEAKRRGDSARLGQKTLANYFNNIVTIFHFAVGKRYPHTAFSGLVQFAGATFADIPDVKRIPERLS
jgi:hypothetical protein